MKTLFLPVRQLSIFLLLLTCSRAALAQNDSPQGGIRGKVTDSLTRLPVDFATISLFKQGATSPFNGVSTDVKGNFLLAGIPTGDYRLTVDFLGYKTRTCAHVIVNSSSINQAGVITLVPISNQLNTVNITAAAPVVENKIDKMVYNAANDLTAQGGVALDVLKKVPMVTVDVDGNVELQGNANVRFLINGKPSSIFGASLADALQSIPASQIKSIEVITSPGAKYDAAGTGGIINIVLKDSKPQGINGSVNLSAGTRLENGALNLNARKGNVGISAFFSGNEQLNTKTLNTNTRQSYNAARDTIGRLLQQGSSPFVRSSYQSGLNFSWSITPKDELTASVGFNQFGNHGTGLTAQDQQTALASGELLPDISSSRSSASRFSFNSTDWSLDYKKSFNKEGQELDFLYTTTYGRNTADASQRTDYLNSSRLPSAQQSNNPGKDRETDISIDYVQPFSKSFTLETGGKVTLENLNNSVATDSLLDNSYVPDPGQTYAFNYRRNIYAAYLSAGFSLFNDFFSGKAGLRYERTDTKADFAGSSIPGYNTFAPSFVLQHKLVQSQSVKFAYSYRIERPDYGDLNPFFNISDPHNISTGNPFLEPEIGHNFEVGYSKSFKKGGNIYLAGFYRYNTNDIQAFSTYYTVLTVNGTDYPDVSLTQRYNIGSQHGIGMTVFGSVPLTDKLNIRSNIQFGERTNSTPGLATVSGFSYRLNLNASYEFARDLLAEVFGNYNSSSKNIQGTRPAFAFYNLAVRKQFWNKKASLGLTTASPFNAYVNQRSTLFGPNFNQSNLRQVPFRSFGITLSYKFGKLEFKKSEHEDNQAPQPPADN
jgi:ferric enterobactin receptor